MKKGFLFAVLSLLIFFQSTPVSALKYRGDLEGSLGVATSDLIEFSNTFLSKSVLDFTTSHGIQINKVYVGLGLGLMVLNFDTQDFGAYGYANQGFSMPFFVKGRYDFWNSKGINPYVSLKAGYLLGIDSMGEIENTNTGYDEEDKAKGLYLQPQAGVRFRTGKNTVLSLGISYNIININRDYYNYRDGNVYNISNSIKGILSLTIGFDF